MRLPQGACDGKGWHMSATCEPCQKHYGDSGPCDEGKPVASPHRRVTPALKSAEEINAASPSRTAARCSVCGLLLPMMFGVMPLHEDEKGRPCQGTMRKGERIETEAA